MTATPESRPAMDKNVTSEMATGLELIELVSNYLGNGGLFNPEMMEHDKVQAMVLRMRDWIKARLATPIDPDEAVILGELAQNVAYWRGVDYSLPTERNRMEAASYMAHVRPLITALRSQLTATAARCETLGKEQERLNGQVQYLKDQVAEQVRIAADAVWNIDEVKEERDELRQRLAASEGVLTGLRDSIKRDLGWDEDKHSEAQASDWRKRLHAAIDAADGLLPPAPAPIEPGASRE